MIAHAMPRGAVVVDVAGPVLDDADRGRLMHPSVGGVILFSRNYAGRGALRLLCESIHALRTPALVVCVDHEGGRVQRFREGFTTIPPMRSLGQAWERGVAAACADARKLGYVMASELREAGVDFTFAPVLDVDFGTSGVIGDRAFSRNPNAIAVLARHLVQGMREGGMASVGKHFPGHGFVAADSHAALPVDARALADLVAADLVPFAALAAHDLDAVMPAHVVYPAIDADLAGFSAFWLQDMLRRRYGFGGMIFSDDLSMAGAHAAGDIVARADAATRAGCDVVLVCNDSAAADQLLRDWQPPANAMLATRWQAMAGRPVNADAASVRRSGG